MEKPNPNDKYTRAVMLGPFKELTSGQVDLLQDAFALMEKAGFSVDIKRRLVGDNVWEIVCGKTMTIQPHTHWYQSV